MSAPTSFVAHPAIRPECFVAIHERLRLEAQRLHDIA